MKKQHLLFISLLVVSLFFSGCSKSSKTSSNNEGSGFLSTPKEILDKVNNAKSNMVGGGNLPVSVDLTSKLPPPGNQGAQNSCVGWSVGYAMKTFQEKNSRNWDLTQGGDIVAQHVFSPAYIYNQINKGNDNGAFFADAFELLRTKGIASLEKDPYDPSDHTTKPDAEADKEASSYKIAWAKKIDKTDLHDLKSYLAKGYPVIIAISFDENFSKVRSEIVNDMIVDEHAMGHAMLLVGYDETKNAFKIMNSWGTSWGDGGYCWMSYNAFNKCIRECWVAKDIDGNKDIPDTDEEQLTYNNPVADELVTGLKIDNVDYNAVNPDDPSAGNSLKINCSVKLDKNYGSTAQIIAFINYKDGKPVISKNPNFSSGEENEAVAYTKTINIDNYNEQTQQFTMYIPYSALDLEGKSNTSLTATPVLFIDDFDATDGDAVPFELKIN
ncbi:hypothetical protein BH10BAC5_BH10BAC5_27870 [soil metagenome]